MYSSPGHANPLSDSAVPHHGHGDSHRRGMVVLRASGVVAASLTLPAETLEALATGATIVALTPRNAVNLNDEIDLSLAGGESGDLVALVVAVQPAASMVDAAGDAVLLRVFAGNQPVLDDQAFAAARAEVEAQWK